MIHLKLIPTIPEDYSVASDRDSFFKVAEKRALIAFEKREESGPKNSSTSCTTNLFFGFFFD
ncbi:hypothetical protein, partial [Janthinobacterium agaricidamnosum]